MPIILVIAIAILDDEPRLLCIHILFIWPAAVGINLTLFDRFLNKVGRCRVVMETVGYGFLHSDRFPIRKRSENIWSSVKVARFDRPILPYLFNFRLIVLKNLQVFFTSHNTNTWRPDKQSHYTVVAYPALIFQVSVDAPLR